MHIHIGFLLGGTEGRLQPLFDEFPSESRQDARCWENGLCANRRFFTFFFFFCSLWCQSNSVIDINSMWLRDSSVQLAIYFPYITKMPTLRLVLAGAIRKLSHGILHDPYANSYAQVPKKAQSLFSCLSGVDRPGATGQALANDRAWWLDRHP